MNRFWKKTTELYPHWHNMPAAGEGTFHRAIGEIPGCTPAPREGIYRPQDYEEMKKQMHWRVLRFLDANAINNMLEKQQYFRGDSFNEPIHGAFGEKL